MQNKPENKNLKDQQKSGATQQQAKPGQNNAADAQKSKQSPSQNDRSKSDI